MDEMPEFNPSSLDGRIKRAHAARKRPHFSYTDWDFMNADWTLDETIYKAAPPSLHGTGGGLALAKHATTGALSDGRLIMWMRSSIADYLGYLFFRNQVADGTADYENCYYVRLDDDGLVFYYFLTGSSNPIDTHLMDWNWAINTWYKIRWTWWTSVDRMYLRTERWDGDAWVTLGGAADIDFEDTNDRWKDETRNRVGIYYMTSKWFDDVEVWGV